MTYDHVAPEMLDIAHFRHCYSFRGGGSVGFVARSPLVISRCLCAEDDEHSPFYMAGPDTLNTNSLLVCLFLTDSQFV